MKKSSIGKMREWYMNDRRSHNLDGSGLKVVFRPPLRYSGVRNGLVHAYVTRKTLFAGERESKETISEQAIRVGLSRILESSIFVQSDRLGQFLHSDTARKPTFHGNYTSSSRLRSRNSLVFASWNVGFQVGQGNREQTRVRGGSSRSTKMVVSAPSLVTVSSRTKLVRN